jgi:S1-C subfamily serine protease
MAEGDVLLEWEGRPVTGVAALARLLDSESIGRACKATILRTSGVMSVTVAPAEATAAT